MDDSFVEIDHHFYLFHFILFIDLLHIIFNCVNLVVFILFINFNREVKDGLLSLEHDVVEDVLNIRKHNYTSIYLCVVVVWIRLKLSKVIFVKVYIYL